MKKQDYINHFRSVRYSKTISDTSTYCGLCELCRQPSTKLKFSESPGALFCKIKQFQYETLSKLKMASIDKYTLCTGVILNEKKKSIFGRNSLLQSSRNKTIIDIPQFLFDVLRTLRRLHDEELNNNECFLYLTKNLNVRNVKINAILDFAISSQMNKSIVNHIQTLNAFQCFSLIITFLNRLPSPIWKLSRTFSAILFSESFNQLPLTKEEVSEKKWEIIETVNDADLVHFKEATFHKLDEIINKMLGLNDLHMSRNEQITCKRTFFYALQRDLANQKPKLRRNILKIILRCFKFEVIQLIYKTFLERQYRHEIKDEILLKEISIEHFSMLANCCAPVMLRLPSKVDSRANRIRIFKVILWNMDSQYLYYSDNEEFGRKVTCHNRCPCGYGNSSSYSGNLQR